MNVMFDLTYLGALCTEVVRDMDILEQTFAHWMDWIIIKHMGA